MVGVLRRVAAVAAALACAACGSAAAPSDEAIVGGQANSQGFVLQVVIPSAVWSSVDEIRVMTTLTWTGAAPQQELWGSGSGPATFGFEEIGGAGRAMGGGGTDDCASTRYGRGVAVPIKVQKSAGWDDGDPNAAFYQAWAKDPVLRLPAGRWRLTVGVDGYLDTCGGPRVQMTVPLELVVR